MHSILYNVRISNLEYKDNKMHICIHFLPVEICIASTIWKSIGTICKVTMICDCAAPVFFVACIHCLFCAPMFFWPGTMCKYVLFYLGDMSDAVNLSRLVIRSFDLSNFDLLLFLIFQKDQLWSNCSSRSFKKIDCDHIAVAIFSKDRLERFDLFYDRIDLLITKNKQFDWIKEQIAPCDLPFRYF